MNLVAWWCESAPHHGISMGVVSAGVEFSAGATFGDSGWPVFA